MNELQTLYNVILSRKTEAAEDSYTAYLFAAGLNKILKKIGEESAETIIAAKDTDNALLVGEASDLIYHLLVMLAAKDIPWADVEAELARRSAKIGNKKTIRETDKDS